MEEDENNQILLDGEEHKDNKENNNEIDFNEKNLGDSVIIGINDKVRNTIYAVLVLISAFSSCDGGIIPQQNTYIKQDFEDEDDALVGFFGSVDYIGRVIGALVFSFILGKVNRKLVLFITLLLKAITLFISLLFKGAIINIIFRGISGISQVFYTSYLPVWCDQYGKKKNRTLMVMLIQLGNPLGIIIGYGIGMACQKILPGTYSGWRLGFGIEGVILIICAFIIIFFKKIYFSEKFILIDDNIGKEEKKEEDDTTNKPKSKSNIPKILCNKLFLFTTLSNSVSFFGMGIVQYWGDKYMELVLKIETTLRFILFGGLCLLGPILGIAFGGILTSKLGGYNKRKAMTFTVILLIIAAVISCLITLGNNTVVFIAFGWCYLFFLCAAIPPESGIIIASLENNLRGDGFALSNSILNLLGSFPSSYAFGSLLDIYKKNMTEEDANNYKHYVYTMITCMALNFAGVIFIAIACIYRFKIKGDLSTNPEEEIRDTENIGVDTQSSKPEENENN
jgi:MFS family permease